MERSLSAGEISVLGGNGKVLTKVQLKRLVTGDRDYEIVETSFAESYYGCEQLVLGWKGQLLVLLDQFFEWSSSFARRARSARLIEAPSIIIGASIIISPD